MHQTEEQRRFPREKADIDAVIYIIAPEETFSAQTFHGKITNLSLAGIGVSIPEMPRAMFQLLLRGRRLARVMARLPGNETESRLFGTIAWIDFRETDSPASCRIGISVDQVSEKTRQELQQALEFMQSQLIPA